MKYDPEAYDNAIDRRDYYADMADSINTVLLTLDQIKDEEFDREGLYDMMTLAEKKTREWDVVVDECMKVYTASVMAGIPFYDPET